MPANTRSTTSSRVRSPTRRSTSCRPSRPVARVISERCCRSSSTRGERAGVDQLAQLLLAEQLAQQVAVERERGGAALGVGRVALVHVGGDVVEQQRGGERRGGLGLDLDERDLARVRGRAAALAARARRARLAGTRGRSRARSGSRRSAGDLEQALGLEALLPERRAAPGVGAGDQQRAGGVLAKARAEQRGAAELGGDGGLDLVGVEQDELGDRLPLAPRARLLAIEIRQVQDDAVVGARLRLPRGRSARACARRARAPRRRGRARRRGRGRTGASRRSRRGSARARSCARWAARAWRPAARAGRRAGCARRARRGRSRAASVSASCSTAQRENAPIASPSSMGRPTESPFQKGTAPGAPGAGVTITRSRPISSMRQVEAPSRNACPGRAS